MGCYLSAQRHLWPTFKPLLVWLAQTESCPNASILSKCWRWGRAPTIPRLLGSGHTESHRLQRFDGIALTGPAGAG